MRIFSRTIIVIILFIFLVSCKKNLALTTLQSDIATGETYYTQFVIRYEKNTHLTTNYRRGHSITINNPIKLIEINNKTITVQIEKTGTEIVIKNVKKHTGDDTFKAFNKLFSKNKVQLSQFNLLEKKHIQTGTVAKGMSKQAVLVAIGYPPITKTANLDATTWVYWSSRFNRFNVNFSEGKVLSVID